MYIKIQHLFFPYGSQGGWAPAALLLNALRNRTIHEDIEVRHLAAPFRITYYTDFLLKRLPELIKQWELEPHLKPSVVVMGESAKCILSLLCSSRNSSSSAM